MDCAALRLALRVIFAVAKMHQLAALGSNGVQILSPFSVRYKKPRLRGAFHIWRRGRDRLRRVAAGPSGDFRCRENASARLRLGSNRVQILSTFSVRYKKTPLARGLSYLAEREGFEPSVRFKPYTHFPGEPVRPLRHLSVRRLLYSLNAVKSVAEAAPIELIIELAAQVANKRYAQPQKRRRNPRHRSLWPSPE